MWIGTSILKIIVIGDSGVGKSSMLHRLSSDSFEEHLQPTIGVDFHVKKMRVANRTFQVTIWDTAGQERFRALSTAYYRQCHGILLVYDVNGKESFDHLDSWMGEVDMFTNRQQVTILLVGNKTDINNRQISIEEARLYAKDRAMDYVETSAKAGEGIWPAFNALVHRIVNSMPHEESVVETQRVLSTLETMEKRGCC